MSRRGNRLRMAQDRGERCTFGDTEMAEAVRKISNRALRAVATQVEFGHSINEVLPWVFPDEVLERLARARGLVEPSSTNKMYTVSSGVRLTLRFGDDFLPPLQSLFQVNPERAGPLLRALAEIQNIHWKFAEVIAVLRYFHTQATASAARYYWPTILGLCPSAPSEIPTRFAEPRNIADWLPIIRSSANTWAASELMPEIEVPSSRMQVCLEQRTVHNGMTYESDARTYSL
jgi:hypothetical protein